MLLRPSLRRSPDAISPTAHYTGHVWARNSLSPEAFDTLEGRALFGALEPAMRLNRALGGATLEGHLLARHRTLDRLLEEAIEAGAVSQVLEVACGMSARGLRFARRHGERLAYIEADLPAMARRKRRALERVDALSAAHRVVELDALAADGPASIDAVAASLDRDRGLAIVTEGLLGYLPLIQVEELWGRFASLLGEFPTGRYLSDLHLSADTGGARVLAFRLLLSTFVRGRVHVHFANAAAARAALLGAGFSEATIHRADRDLASGADDARVRIVEAAT